ncbi:MAG: hypothetical protein GX542_07725 [Rhodococcus sp.]|nr:hypothetical protein [Rhodococcus sp. (in: high G+C Gram-positive bacteria)]
MKNQSAVDARYRSDSNEMSRARAYLTVAGCATIVLTTTIASSLVEAIAS